MTKTPREISGFIALSVVLKGGVWSTDVKHFLYIKPHEPREPDEDTARSLFLVNIPVATTEHHIRHLFANQLEAGRVERVEFPEDGITKTTAKSSVGLKTSKKRKRQTVEELETNLDTYHLPSTFPSQLHTSGSSAVVVFVDRPSMEASLKAVRRATKSKSDLITWGSGLGSKLPTMGLARYQSHNELQYPSRAALLSISDNYMAAYTSLESARSLESSRLRSVPDEDGFVTVTRSSKGGVLKQSEAEELRMKQQEKEKKEKVEDFYRFQMRERRKAEAGRLLKDFEEDKRKVEEMRRRRGAVRPEG